MHKTLLLLILFTLLSLGTGAATPKRYTILEMNASTVIICGRTYKVNDTFTITSPDDIVWKPDLCIKVRDTKTGQLSLLTKAAPSGKSFFRRLGDYLVRQKLLATRSYGPSAVSHRDSLIQLLDTIALTIDRMPQKDYLYIATYAAGNFRQRTKLPTSPDGTTLYLTRDIYGHYAKPRTSYITILRYDLRTDAAPDSLGYLYVQPMPLKLDK